jgi:ATP-binding cassette, subfamily B, bacterial
MTISKLLQRLGGYALPYLGSALLIVAGLLLEMGFTALVPFSFKFIVDQGLVGGDRTLLINIVIGLASGAILVSVAGLARDYLYARVSSRVLADIRQRLFNSMQHLSMGFHSRARAGDILSRFSGDLAAVEAALANALPWGVLPILDVLASTTLLFVLDWRLAMLAMLVWPMCLLGPRIFAPRAVAASYIRRRVEGEALAAVQENLAGQPLVKALNLQAQSQHAFAATNERLTASVRRVSFFSAMVERSASIGIMLLQVAVLGAGAWMAAESLLTVGTLAAFQALFMSLSFSLSYATQYVPTLVQAAGGMQRIDELLHEIPAVVDAPGATALPPLQKEIVIDDVSFGYTSDDDGLFGVTLTIPAGTSVAFVGASGAGKSTLLNLLMRLYDPQSGRVLIDGRDIRTATQLSLRAQMSVVFQESFLFNSSIAENIRMGKLDATRAEIERAAQAAQVHDTIMALPDGYDTVAGERGGRLSGGQRQRIAIARAIIRDPRILLLDEATSALDSNTEAAVNETLAQAGKHRTTICVTHRLATAARADCIYVFDEGRLVEQGSHDALLAANGRYHALWTQQGNLMQDAAPGPTAITTDRLRAIRLLEGLDDNLFKDAANRFVTEHYPSGHTVIFEGDPGDRFYIVANGLVEVLQSAGSGVPYRLAVLGDGCAFGEIALLWNVTRTASVRTLKPCTFISLQREQFDYLLGRAPALRKTLESMHPRTAGIPRTDRRIRIADRRGAADRRNRHPIASLTEPS